jgi:hypothetical protein
LLLAPYYHLSGKPPRYYQEIAINRAVQAILQGKPRVLLTMATGTGKTIVAFQICWRLWNSRWNRTGDYGRPRILYLADRNVLVDDPKDKIFAPFGDARWKIEGEANKYREMYFSTYQAIARDERRPGLYRDYSPDFFDLIIVDECHRGSARDESNWRDILEYFEPDYCADAPATPRTARRAIGQRATIRSRRSCSRFSVWPHFQSLNAGKNLKTLARRKGRNNTTIGLKSRPRPNVRNTRTVKDNFDHLLRSDQLRTMARLTTKGRIWVSMYSRHTGLSE